MFYSPRCGHLRRLTRGDGGAKVVQYSEEVEVPRGSQAGKLRSVSSVSPLWEEEPKTTAERTRGGGIKLATTQADRCNAALVESGLETESRRGNETC